MKIDFRFWAVVLSLGLTSTACKTERPSAPDLASRKAAPGPSADNPSKKPDPGSGDTEKEGSGNPPDNGSSDTGKPRPDEKPKDDGKVDDPGDTSKPKPNPPPTKPIDNAELKAVCTPGTVEVKNQEATAGAIFAKAIPDAKTILSDIALTDCLSMYKKASEVRKQSKITVVIRDFEGVAYATPQNGEIHFSAAYIKQFSNGKDAAAIKQEMYGVMTHEINHLYQNFWKDGKYTPFSEGICDAIRARAKLYPNGRKRKGGTYWDSYTTTGYFFLYLDEKYPDFIYKMNQAAKTWNENFWKQTTGKTADDLWNEYQSTF